MRVGSIATLDKAEVSTAERGGARMRTGSVVAVAAAPGLQFASLHLARRGNVLLADLTATVPAGSTLAVMGRSGTGKTTLVRTIAGLAEPQSGRVDRPAGRVPVVFQEPRLLPWRIVRQNVELVLPPGERDRAVEWLIRVGLGNVIDAYPATLSGGMRQRVSIARALACDSPIVLVDEPFSHLDVVTADQLRADLSRHLDDTGRTCIWVTHDPAEAAAVARRTLVMAGAPHGDWHIVDHHQFPTPELTTAGLAAALEHAGPHLNHGERS